MADVHAPELPALKIARDLLAHDMYPAPEECLNDLDAITALFYVEQWAEALLAQWAVYLGNTEGTDDEPPEQAVQAYEVLGDVAGRLVAACVLMGLLPPEAQPQ